MSSFDSPISPAPQTNFLKNKPVSAYLITWKDPDIKGPKQFLYTKIIEETNNTLKVIGLDIEQSPAEVFENYASILEQANKASYVEVSFPWHRITRIQSCIFRKA